MTEYDHHKLEVAARIASGKAPAPDPMVCPNCHESRDLAKIKGCIRCLKCQWKEDCYGI